MSDTEKKELTPEEKNAKKEEINKHLNTAYAEVAAACKIADEFGLSFSWDLAYGMGGFYQGGPEDGNDDYDDDREVGWFPSSQGC